MTTVVWLETGRVIVCPDDIARRWVAEGLAVLREAVVETTSRTTVPRPARVRGTETR